MKVDTLGILTGMGDAVLDKAPFTDMGDLCDLKVEKVCSS